MKFSTAWAEDTQRGGNKVMHMGPRGKTRLTGACPDPLPGVQGLLHLPVQPSSLLPYTLKHTEACLVSYGAKRRWEAYMYISTFCNISIICNTWHFLHPSFSLGNWWEGRWTDSGARAWPVKNQASLMFTTFPPGSGDLNSSKAPRQQTQRSPPDPAQNSSVHLFIPSRAPFLVFLVTNKC